MVADHRYVSPVEQAYERPDKYSEQSNPEQYTKQGDPRPHPGPKNMSISQHEVISFIVFGMIFADMLLCYYLFIGTYALHRTLTPPLIPAQLIFTRLISPTYRLSLTPIIIVSYKYQKTGKNL